MYLIIWQFRVRPGSEAAFEEAYGPAGDWARLFQRSDKYVQTELFRKTTERDVYITIDCWQSLDAFEEFQSEHRDDYQDLDRNLEPLTEEESWLGSFES